MVTKVSANSAGTSERGMSLHMGQILMALHQPVIGGRQPSEQRSDVDSCGPWEPQSKRKNVAGWALRLVDIQRHPYSGDQGASPIPPARDETGGY